MEIPERRFSDPSAGNIVIDQRGQLWVISLLDRVEVRAVQLGAALLAFKLGRAVNRASRPLVDRSESPIGMRSILCGLVRPATQASEDSPVE